jgi:hypothetical protein
MPSRFSRFSRSTDVRSDGIPSSPPPEVLDAIARAHEVCEELAASGQHVHFDLNETTGRLVLELIEDSGAPPRSLSAREVLDLAAGVALP